MSYSCRDCARAQKWFVADQSSVITKFLFLSIFSLSGYVISQPSAVQNAQIIYDVSTNRFVVSWDPPPEQVTQYFVYIQSEGWDQNTYADDDSDLYGYEFDIGGNGGDEDELYLSANTTEFTKSADANGYGEIYVSIRAENDDGEGPNTQLNYGLIPETPSTPTNLTYEIREDDLVAYFSWDEPASLNLPPSGELYYKVTYVTDVGVSRTRSYASTFAALDLTDDQYWDYSVSACVFQVCSNPTEIRAELSTQVVNQIDGSFESAMPAGWVSNGWLRNTGTTPTSGTGPAFAASGSYYMYFETSGTTSGDEVTMESPHFDHLLKLHFRYHMYGSSIGTLYVDIQEQDSSSWHTKWEKSLQQHSRTNSVWASAEIDLSNYEHGVKIRFRGRDRNGYRGDMAVDDIRITKVIQNEGYGLKAEYSAYPHGLKISWKEQSAAQYYEVARSIDNGNSWDENYYSGSDTEFIDTDIDDLNDPVYYKARACDSQCGDWSSTPLAQ